MLYRIIIFLLLALSMIGFFYQIKKKDLLKTKLHEAMDRLDKTSAERAREAKKQILYQNEKLKFTEALLQKPRKRFLYSRLNYITGITLELWMILKIAMTAVIYFVSYAIFKDILNAIIAAVIFWASAFAIETILAMRNYRAVDENLIQFINLLGNFSITSGEITSIIHKISKYMPEPLCSVLEEFYIDAQTSGDTSVALYMMAEKIEHPKFKGLIRNIEACINYTSNFKSVVDNSRKIIMDEQQAKKERKAIANGAVVNMFMICIMLIVALLIVDGLVAQSIWDVFLNTGLGRLCLIIVIITLLMFWYTLARAER